MGFRNYEKIVHDELFWTSLKNTVYYTVLVIPTVLIVGIGLAALLNRPISFRPLWIVLLIVPNVASTVAASVIWSYLAANRRRGDQPDHRRGRASGRSTFSARPSMSSRSSWRSRSGAGPGST